MARISHDMLRNHAGMGVQWGGNDRYADAEEKGTIFPRLNGEDRELARLVRPPDEFLARLKAPLPTGTLSLISGRGRPGRRAVQRRARYNSDIKTLPICGLDPDEHFVELHPDVAVRLDLSDGAPCVCSAGTVRSSLRSPTTIAFPRVPRSSILFPAR